MKSETVTARGEEVTGLREPQRTDNPKIFLSVRSGIWASFIFPFFKQTFIHGLPLAECCVGFFFFFFSFWLHRLHAKVPGPGIQPTPQQ